MSVRIVCVLTWMLLSLVGCVEPSVNSCPTVDCPYNEVCDGRGGCARQAALDVCLGKPDGAMCSFDGTPLGQCSGELCLPVGCGNYFVTPGEVCDDGNTTNGDGCSADCKSNETCPNATVDPSKGEQCDDGNSVDGDGCQSDCKNPRCGDGVIDASLNEVCDAGNLNSMLPNAACRPNCQAVRCGDGVLDSGEVCDDANVTSGDNCAGDCKSDETCGNGVIDVIKGEVCDDSNVIGGDGCSANCTSTEACGNGVLDTARGEVCDDGNIVSGDMCSSDCRSIETCGNMIVDTIFEQCDLGMMANSDLPNSMCRINCRLPACGDDILDDALGEVCDDGPMNANTADRCRLNCQVPRCGDSVRDTLEVCDDGNSTSGDNCSADCRSLETCQNGILDAAKGEQCDDGNAVGTDACRNDCTLPVCGDMRLDPFEACDLGIANSSAPNAACRPNCQLPRCGDNIRDNLAGEVCDDGNITSGDNCSADCRSLETCGNLIVDTAKGEQCDAGGLNSDAANAPCRSSCSLPKCGDGAVDTVLGEGCDRGAANSNAPNSTCRTSCQPLRCGDNILDTLYGEICDDGNSVAGDGCSPDCRSVETCGNGIVDVSKGEQCDAGGLNADTANAPCRTTCVLPRCSDSIVDTAFGEACDLGASNSNVANATCRVNCQPQRCGDLIFDNTKGEVCDDGNTTANDGCSPDCTSTETCGNGIVDVSKGEQCDAGGLNSNLANAPCRTTCTLPRCGDAAADTNLGETCDLGALNSNVANAICRTNCQSQRCGDNILDDTKGEICDDGNALSGDGCSNDCKSKETCGNGILDGAKGEQCDDGNLVNADFCHSNCTLPTCGDSIVDYNEQCDVGAGNSNNPNAACRTNCLNRRCGDLIIDNLSGEACEDGNLLVGDGCSADCLSNETCGNGYLDLVKGEQCDDNNVRGRDGCNACKAEDAIVLVPGQIPPPRAYFRMAYDAARQRVVMFGGYGTTGPLGDTWEWDGVGWTQMRPLTAPTPRYYHDMAYDPKRHRVVLFSGYANAYKNDTWEWDGINWIEKVPAAAPSQRYGARLAYDSVGARILMYGGYDPLVGFRNDTWSWNGTNWTQLAPTTLPPGSYLHTMATDPVRKQIVMNGAGLANVTFVWDGTNWLNKGATTGMPTDYGLASAFHAAIGKVVIPHGTTTTVCNPTCVTTTTSVTWEWDGTSWTSVTGTAPSPRSYPGLAYDAARNQTVLFGGVASSYQNQTWLRTGAIWAQPAAFVQPTARHRAPAAYDPVRKRIVMFGGSTASSGQALIAPTTNNETWEWDGRQWFGVAATTPPAARAGGWMDYNSSTRTVMMFGGDSFTTAPVVYNDLWSYNGAAWSQPASSTRVSKDRNATMAYDAGANRIVEFGGRDDTSGTTPNLDTTWTWSSAGWASATPTTRPPRRRNAALAYDPVRGRTVLFGGFGGNGATDATLSDVWEWSGTSWQSFAATGPSGRKGLAMTYNPDAKKVVVFGNSGLASEDLWEWSGTRWTQRAIDASVALPSKYRVAVAYDAARTGLVTFGGRTTTFAATGVTQLIQYRSNGPVEACTYAAIDYDNDLKAGCADEECWGVCDPLHPPGTTRPAGAPYCGDGTCTPSFEDCRICPGDCLACPAGPCGDFECTGTETAATCPSDC